MGAEASSAADEVNKLGNAEGFASTAASESKGLFSGLADSFKGTLEAAAPLAAMFGIGLGVKETVDVVSAAQKSMADLNTAFENTKSGLPTGQLQQFDDSMAALGHDDADANEALANTTTATGSATQALGDMATIADLAAYKHISLADASTMYIKAAQGQAKALKDLGIPTMITAQSSAQALANVHLTLANAVGTLDNAQITLTSDQNKYNDAVAKYGASSSQAQTALDTLTKAHESLDKAQQTVTNDQAKVQEAIKATNDPLYQQGQLNTELESKIHGLADAQANTLGGSMDVLGAKVKNFISDSAANFQDWLVQNQDALANIANTIFNVVVAAFSTFEQGIMSVVNAIVQLYTKNKSTFDSIAQIITTVFKIAFPIALGAVSLAFHALAAAIQFVGNNLSWLGPIILGVAAAFATYKAIQLAITLATQAWGVAQAVLNAIMAINPVTLIIIGIGILIGIIILLVTHLQQVGDFFKTIFNDIMGVVSQAVNWIKSHWELLVDIFLGPIGILLTTVIDHFGQIRSFISGVVSDVTGFFTGLWNDITNIFDNIGNAIQDAFKTAFNFVANIWNSTLGSISFTIPGWVPGLGGDGWSFPKIPTFAAGGIVNKPTLLIAGEAGPEAIVPLSGPNAPSSSSAGGETIYIDLRQSKFMSDKDIDTLLDKLSKRFTTSVLPRAGVKITR